MTAHDLRSPLSSIRGLSEFLLNEIFGSLTEDQKEYTNIINKTSNEMLPLVNDLLDVSVIESGNLDIKPSKKSL
jgi:two-component system, sensor histidine kinase and response regulator